MLLIRMAIRATSHEAPPAAALGQSAAGGAGTVVVTLSHLLPLISTRTDCQSSGRCANGGSVNGKSHRPGLRRCHGSPMSLHDQRAVEDQDLVDQSLLLIAKVDDQRVQADVHVNHLEAQVGDTAKTFCPILPKFGLAADHAVAVIEQLCGYGRREDDVIGKMAQQQLQVVGVPTLHPAVNEILRLNAIHAEIIAHRSKAVDLLILAALLGGTASGAA